MNDRNLSLLAKSWRDAIPFQRKMADADAGHPSGMRANGYADALNDCADELEAALASEPAVRRLMREKIAKVLCACKSLTPEDVEGDWATPRLREICLHEADAVLELFDEEPDALAEARNDANANYELWKEMRERAERAVERVNEIAMKCGSHSHWRGNQMGDPEPAWCEQDFYPEACRMCAIIAALRDSP